MAPRPLAPHVLAAMAAVQRKRATPPAPRAVGARALPPASIPPSIPKPAPHVLASIQARLAPAPVVAPPASHVQAAIQAKPGLRAAPPRAPHVQAAIDRTRSPGSVQAKAARHLWPVVQPMEQQKHSEEEEESKQAEIKENVGEKRKRRSSIKITHYGEDPLSYLDEPNFGKTEDYEEKRAEFDREQRLKFKKFKKGVGELERIPHFSSNQQLELSILDPKTFLTSFQDLKGNTQAEPYALRIEVGGEQHFFKTSYNQDVGFAPLFLDEQEKFRAGKNRPFKEIAGDLDDFIGGDESLRRKVGAMIKEARDGGKPTWGEEAPKEEKRLTLDSEIAELAIIFSLDLARAEELSEKARRHQNALLEDSKLGFQDMLSYYYIGIKASRLRDEEEYKSTKYY